jgi:hypothetical protein
MIFIDSKLNLYLLFINDFHILRDICVNILKIDSKWWVNLSKVKDRFTFNDTKFESKI